VVTAALATVLAGCAPRDPVTYTQMACAGQDGLASGSDEHSACVRFVAKNAPTLLLALGRRDAGTGDSRARRPRPTALTDKQVYR
jgi:hypothetical protein